MSKKLDGLGLDGVDDKPVVRLPKPVTASMRVDSNTSFTSSLREKHQEIKEKEGEVEELAREYRRTAESLLDEELDETGIRPLDFNDISAEELLYASKVNLGRYYPSKDLLDRISDELDVVIRIPHFDLDQPEVRTSVDMWAKTEVTLERKYRDTLKTAFRYTIYHEFYHHKVYYNIIEEQLVDRDLQDKKAHFYAMDKVDLPAEEFYIFEENIHPHLYMTAHTIDQGEALEESMNGVSEGSVVRYSGERWKVVDRKEMKYSDQVRYNLKGIDDRSKTRTDIEEEYIEGV